MARRNVERRDESVAVAIDRDKGSQYALKWAVDHLVAKGQSITLLHVKTKPNSSILTATGNHVRISDVDDDVAKAYKKQLESQAKEVFLPFRCLCSRKDVGKGKISSVRSASVPPPTRSLPSRTQLQPLPSNVSEPTKLPSATAINPRYRGFAHRICLSSVAAEPVRPQNPSRNLYADMEIRSPFTRGASPIKYEPSIPDSDISFVSSGRPSTDGMFSSLYDNMEVGTPGHYDNRNSGSSYSGNRPMYLSSSSQETGRTSWSSQNKDDVENEMRRLKQELKQTMDMYSAACKEALSAKQRAKELHSWKLQEEQKIEEARLVEEAALSLAQKEKAKCKTAIEAAQAAQWIAELEAKKRMNVEMKASKEADERKMAISSLGHDLRYRKYTIEEIETATELFSSSRKIGEGGYGPVYMCNLDHTPVAIKVLRPEAAQGQSQFQQEVEVLSCIRHPNMVLLLGACPEYGCLVYEYMANGSLEDRLFRRHNTPVLPWQVRFRIAAEIATGLLFLHQTKPEPLVHRDLKPANILLDRNYVSKISDVGLARLVPPSVANSITQYRMTSTAGTFCYIDPEYQQTGMLGTKSDIYSLGILLLQIITAKPPMGLTHHVENAIEKGTFGEILDSAVPDWPMEEALNFAKLALKCSELRRKDRPDLGQVVLPELNKLRDLAEENMPFITLGGGAGPSPNHSQVSSPSVQVSP
ncbi:hypothetical protein REPUB_Repub11eG0081100 [Reevesia pubescens]